MKVFTSNRALVGLALVSSLTLAACGQTATTAEQTLSIQAVTFDDATGSGFVGKGDVQLALGLSNALLQQQASTLATKFSYNSTTVSETSWVCTNPRNENTQERERTTTTETAGLVAAVTRDGKKQVTGFNLTGFSGSATTTSTTEGNSLNSCPNNWTLTTAAGNPVITSTSGGLFIDGVSLE